MKELKRVIITPQETVLNGECISRSGLTPLYREFCGDYPKFFKMDSLCKLGFMGAELLLNDISLEEKGNMAIVLFNRNGSLITDRNYQGTLGADNYFPSPALFVYTLANIVTGEIAIRHKIYGETSFYLLDTPDWAEIERTVRNTFCASSASLILAGWVDYETAEDYLADLRLMCRE